MGFADLAALAMALIPGAGIARDAGGAREAPIGGAAIQRQFAQAAKNPLTLRMFLRDMPKGGDLHNHLSGAIWAEDFIDWARAEGFCTTPDGLGLMRPDKSGSPCPAGHALALGSGDDTAATDRLIDGMSTRGWQQGIGRDRVSGHTQFFQTFERFGPIAHGHAGPMLAAALRQAASDRLSYLELDHNTDALSAYTSAASATPMGRGDIAATFEAEGPGVEAVLAQGSAELAKSEAEARQILGCSPGSREAPPPCAISVHYLFQALRALPPRQVFRSLMLGFAIADRDPRWVGVNIVMPEDAPIALADYDLHMAMIAFLAARYPKVRRSLHAGELAPGLVRPRDLADHIAKAVAAGAERIGHGVDIAYEDHASQTLATMAKNHVAVEINLTSNDVILGVRGGDHPVNLYRAHGVPIVLATDDQGVLRSDMTAQYVSAVREQGFAYSDLKQAARASLEYAFVPGQSLWRDHHFGARQAPCAQMATPACQRLMASSEKARLQADLETRLAQFERGKIEFERGKIEFGRGKIAMVKVQSTAPSPNHVSP